MNEILLALLTMIVLWSVMGWIIKREHDKTYKEILITHPFDTLQRGRVAIFKSGLAAEVGNFVLLRLPGYDMIWKVVKREGEKVELENYKKEKLTDFPVCHIWGKLVDYKS
jgi:SOS-response transcriptional repressor LexA